MHGLASLCVVLLTPARSFILCRLAVELEVAIFYFFLSRSLRLFRRIHQPLPEPGKAPLQGSVKFRFWEVSWMPQLFFTCRLMLCVFVHACTRVCVCVCVLKPGIIILSIVEVTIHLPIHLPWQLRLG